MAETNSTSKEVSPTATLVVQKPVVAVEASFTKNMGNYNSGKCGVSLSIPCEFAEVNEVFDFAVSWVDDKMEKLVEKLNAAAS